MYKYDLPQLNYNYDALEPYIDAETMEIHHTKHHQAYRDNFVKVLENYPQLMEKSPEDILRQLKTLEVNENDRKTIQNHGGGFVNHNIFWESMSPTKEIDEGLNQEITETFGSIEKFKELFNQAAATHFGSGWAWLVRNKQNQLEVYSLPNQDSPYTLEHEPVLCLDVWEHAYYLNYQNKRVDYIDNWWNVVKMI